MVILQKTGEGVKFYVLELRGKSKKVKSFFKKEKIIQKDSSTTSLFVLFFPS